jgi:hypothetical protein
MLTSNPINHEKPDQNLLFFFIKNCFQINIVLIIFKIDMWCETYLGLIFNWVCKKKKKKVLKTNN